MASVFKKYKKKILVGKSTWADGGLDTKWSRKYTKKLLNRLFRRTKT